MNKKTDLYKDEFGNYQEVDESSEDLLDGQEDDELDEDEDFDETSGFFDSFDEDEEDEDDEDSDYARERSEEFDSED